MDGYRQKQSRMNRITEILLSTGSIMCSPLYDTVIIGSETTEHELDAYSCMPDKRLEGFNLVARGMDRHGNTKYELSRKIGVE